MVPVDISPRQRLEDVVKPLSYIPFGRTDCALPMIWALGFQPDDGDWRRREYSRSRERIVEADAFVLYTDSETWSGPVHPSQALKRYRRESAIPAKLAVVGMIANDFSIADPHDAGMLDVVGFDSTAPQLISDFIAA